MGHDHHGRSLDAAFPCCAHAIPDRRRFLGGAALTTLAFAAAPMLARIRPARASGHTEALLLCCMDYRLVDDVTHYMTDRGLEDNYDQVILAGASLGPQIEAFPDWSETFWQHLDLSQQLHGIQEVIIMDHRDCGAYKKVLGIDLAADPEKETQVHREKMAALSKEIHARHPELHTQMLLMALDGSVLEVS